jgi:hypothetical protein
MRAQIEWKVPTHRRSDLGDVAAHLVDALAHLAGGLVGEGDGEDAPGGHALFEELGDAVGDDARLAGARAGEDQQRRAAVVDGRLLFGVELHARSLPRLTCRAPARRRCRGP